MRISSRDWNNYIDMLHAIRDRATDEMQTYIDMYGTSDMADYAYGLVTKYGEASGELACQMYDAIAEASGRSLPSAIMADTASYHETAKAVYGTLNNKTNSPAQTVGRLVKQTAADTTLQNAQRDGAKFAWIPHGETCPFCIMLASRGWQNVSKRALKYGHAEHIHANCDCEYAISFDKNPKVEGYDPNVYLKIYEEASGKTQEEKLKVIREQLGETERFSSVKLSKVLDDEYEAFENLVNDAPTKKLFQQYTESAKYNKASGGGYYQPATNSINFSYEKHEGLNKFSTIAHESGHMFDKNMGRYGNLSFKEVDLINEKCNFGSGIFKTLNPMPSNSDEFLSALREDMANLRSKVADKSIREELLSTTKLRNASSGVQDALDGFYSTQKNYLLPWGHGDKYYNNFYNTKISAFSNQKSLQEAYKELGFDASNIAKTKTISRQYEAASEAWANITSAATCGGEELDAVKKYLPNAYEAFINIILPMMNMA